MAQPAHQYDPRPTWNRPAPSAAAQPAATKKTEEEREDVSIKIGKMIFYITCALGLWFFYWFNGIQCPC
jgi:hypothetical protein